VTRLFVKSIGKTFRVNIPDSLLFYKSEPFMQVYCVDPHHMTLRMEKRREKIQLREMHTFFKRRRNFGVLDYEDVPRA
jgi:hypothetical protein